LNAAIDAELLRVTQDLLVEHGVERLSMDEVARRSGTSKTTIYRRWPSKTALVVSATSALFHAPEVPDSGDLREDLVACGRAFVRQDGRSLQVMASVVSASRHDPVLRDAARAALGAPFSELFKTVMTRAVWRGTVSADVDVATIAEVFPAVVYQRSAALGLAVTDADVARFVDAVLLPSLLQPAVTATTNAEGPGSV
jgi:AcrR family transcriptional regulator